MFYRLAYYIVMAIYAAWIAFILADRFPGFFNNFAVQLLSVCGGMAALYWLLHIERGDAVDNH